VLMPLITKADSSTQDLVRTESAPEDNTDAKDISEFSRFFPPCFGGPIALRSDYRECDWSTRWLASDVPYLLGPASTPNRTPGLGPSGHVVLTPPRRPIRHHKAARSHGRARDDMASMSMALVRAQTYLSSMWSIVLSTATTTALNEGTRQPHQRSLINAASSTLYSPNRAIPETRL